MSTWDGNEVRSWMEGLGVSEPDRLAEESSQGLDARQRQQMDQKLLKKSKALQYMMDGQDYPPERAAGWIQFGMWLLRPRVVREFRGHATPLAPVKPYWMETVKAVDRVYAYKTLTEFWRHGDLVANSAHPHPYQVDVPDSVCNRARWFLLDTNLDAPRPWNQHTDIPVFSLALVRGEAGKRRWLLYAHSPLEDRREVRITVPDYEHVIVDVPRAGAFYLIEEAARRLSRVGA
jgi:hypothetical protein